MGSYFKLTKDYEALRAMHARFFPGEDIRDFTKDKCWFIMNDQGRRVGFCSLRVCAEDTVFFSRIGVSEKGHGHHRKAISYRLKWAKRNGYKWVVTYASVDNYASIANLIKLRFELYEPEYDYAGKGFLYFRKNTRPKK